MALLLRARAPPCVGEGVSVPKTACPPARRRLAGCLRLRVVTIRSSLGMPAKLTVLMTMRRTWGSALRLTVKKT